MMRSVIVFFTLSLVCSCTVSKKLAVKEQSFTDVKKNTHVRDTAYIEEKKNVVIRDTSVIHDTIVIQEYVFSRPVTFKEIKDSTAPIVSMNVINKKSVIKVDKTEHDTQHYAKYTAQESTDSIDSLFFYDNELKLKKSLRTPFWLPILFIILFLMSIAVIFRFYSKVIKF